MSVAGDRRPRRLVTSRISGLPGRIRGRRPRCVVVVNKWDGHRKDKATLPADGEGAARQVYFDRWAPMLFTSASAASGWRASLLGPLLAVEQTGVGSHLGA